MQYLAVLSAHERQLGQLDHRVDREAGTAAGALTVDGVVDLAFELPMPSVSLLELEPV